MTHTRSIRRKSGVALTAVGVAALVAACGSSGHAATTSGTPASDHTLQISLSHGHLTGPGDRSIYLWMADGHNMSHCTGACAAAWPPLLTKAKPSAGSGVKGSDLSTIRRGSERQVTDDGHPLYYFAGDSRGTTRGQGSDQFGAKWWLVNPSGAAITSHASSATSGSGSSSHTSTSGGGGSSWG